jgi:hypothetical protein
MRSIGIAATMLAVTLAVAGCKNRKEEPIPGPRAAAPHAGWPRTVIPHPSPRASAPAADISRPRSTNGPDAPSAPGTASPDGPRRHGASGISWFQGGFEEAFSCPKCTVMLWREALDR